MRSAADKLADFHSNPQYERRAVIFMDILGWRSQIEAAGNDPTQIGQLRRSILQITRIARMPDIIDAKVSTFADNIVFSQPVKRETSILLGQIALLQASVALYGFLVRGGVTIGNIVHDDEVVFGPALNRAYYLENKVAKFPRIVVDPEVLHEFGNMSLLVREEANVHFLDPFTTKFLKAVMSQESTRLDDFLEAGVPALAPNLVRKFAPDQLLQGLLNLLKPKIRAPLLDEHYEKVAWLFDRIAQQLGQPLSSSYPRAYPPRP